MRRLLGGALVIGLIATGCGGNSRDSAAGAGQSQARIDAERTTDSLTKTQFVAHFNEVCRRHWPRIMQNAAEYSRWQSPNLSKRKLFEKTVRFSYMAGFTYYVFNPIHDLGAPEQEEHKGTTVQITLKEAAENAMHRVWLSSPEKLQSLFAEYNEAARQYGLGECLVAGAHLPHF